MPHYDVIILGLGGMGSAAACHLASRKLRVLGLDQFSPPHERGSSHGQTRVIRQAYFEHPAYVPLLLRAYKLWHELEQRSGQTLLLKTGGLMLGTPEAEVVAGSLQSARQHGLPYELLERNQIAKHFPMFRVPDTTVGLLEPEAGVLFCERAIQAHLAMAADSGAELRFNTPVREWSGANDKSSVIISTATERFTADHLVITAGAWTQEILIDCRFPLEVERQVMFWFQPHDGTSVFTPDRFPVFIWQHPSGATPYGFPAVDGPSGGVKTAFYRKPFREACTATNIDRSIRSDDLEAIRKVLREFLPLLDGELLRASTCLYTMTPDHNFVIGHHPAHPQVHIAGGFSGHGFKFCSVVGEILADLTIKGKTHFDLELFSPARFRQTG